MLAWAMRHDSHGVHYDTLCFLPEGDEPDATGDKWLRLPWLDEPSPVENTTGYPTYEAALEAKEARIAELEGTCMVYWTQREQHEHEIAQLKKRQAELLETIRKLSNETPFPEEVQDALAQRGKLLAEIGTLKGARVALNEARSCIAFFTSVIKSGESWTAHCEAAREKFITAHEAVLLQQGPEQLPDLDLLRKLASGEGGRRTGDLMRRGWLEVEVTKKGWAQLCEKPAIEGDHSFENICNKCGDRRVDVPCSVCPHVLSPGESGEAIRQQHFARVPCWKCGSTDLRTIRVRPPLTARE
jgi:hypothetical protein